MWGKLKLKYVKKCKIVTNGNSTNLHLDFSWHSKGVIKIKSGFTVHCVFQCRRANLHHTSINLHRTFNVSTNMNIGWMQGLKAWLMVTTDCIYTYSRTAWAKLQNTKQWNKLPLSFKSAPTLSSIKSQFKTFLFKEHYKKF